MNETQLKNQVQKAQRAEELFNDPLIQEFIVAVRGDLLNKFESTELADEESRKAAWHQSQVLKQFIGKFEKTIKEGKRAKLTLMEKAKKHMRNVI
mgnify:CR=1 FL=1